MRLCVCAYKCEIHSVSERTRMLKMLWLRLDEALRAVLATC